MHERSLDEKSITVIRMNDPARWFYLTSYVLDTTPVDMLKAEMELNELGELQGVDRIGGNILGATVKEVTWWRPAEQKVLTQLIAGLGWRDQDVFIYDKLVLDGKPTDVLREIGFVNPTGSDLKYSTKTHAA